MRTWICRFFEESPNTLDNNNFYYNINNNNSNHQGSNPNGDAESNNLIIPLQEVRPQERNNDVKNVELQTSLINNFEREEENRDVVIV